MSSIVANNQGADAASTRQLLAALFAYPMKPSDRFVPFKTPHLLLRGLDQGMRHGVNCSWELEIKSGQVTCTNTTYKPLSK